MWKLPKFEYIIIIRNILACQCNGHSKCSDPENPEVCDQPCKDNTIGSQCETCTEGYFGNPVNGGICKGIEYRKCCTRIFFEYNPSLCPIYNFPPIYSNRMWLPQTSKNLSEQDWKMLLHNKRNHCWATLYYLLCVTQVMPNSISNAKSITVWILCLNSLMVYVMSNIDYLCLINETIFRSIFQNYGNVA